MSKYFRAQTGCSRQACLSGQNLTTRYQNQQVKKQNNYSVNTLIIMPKKSLSNKRFQMTFKNTINIQLIWPSYLRYLVKRNTGEKRYLTLIKAFIIDVYCIVFYSICSCIYNKIYNCCY